MALLTDGHVVSEHSSAQRVFSRPVSRMPNGMIESLVLPDASDTPDQSRESLSQRAYQQIGRALTTGKLPLGHRLILRPLAAELSLSPTPVREALLRLVSEQALTLDERSSAVVPVMSRAGYLELTEMREDLEARAAERAVHHATDAEIDVLEEANARCIAASVKNQHVARLDANADFHCGICRAGRSPLIMRTLGGLWMRLGPVYALSFDQKVPPIGPDGHPHDRLIAALRRRDVAAARAAALADIAETNALLEPYLVN